MTANHPTLATLLLLAEFGTACSSDPAQSTMPQAADPPPATAQTSGTRAPSEKILAANSGNIQNGVTPATPDTSTDKSSRPSGADSGGQLGANAAAGFGQAGVGAPSVPGSNAEPRPAAGGDVPTTGSANPNSSGPRPRRAVSADFLAKTLSVVDVEKLKPGATRSDALIGTVDLSAYSPGPLAVAVTPDGKTALVSVSAGWLGLVGTDVPAGNGTLVFVDLESLSVKGELFTGANPMGILITQDGTHAYVGQMSDTYMAYVDIEKRSFERIATGNQWNEELAMDDTGTVAILTAGTAGDAVTFTPHDGAKSLGQTRGLSADAGGTAFFPGTKLAFVVQAPTQLTNNLGGYNVIDASDPRAPKVTDEVRVPNDQRISYPATSAPSRKSIVYPSTDAGTLYLLEFGLDGQKAKEVQKLKVGSAEKLAYGLHCDDRGRVLVAVGIEHYVALVDLTTGESTVVPWEITQSGPLDIKFIP